MTEYAVAVASTKEELASQVNAFLARGYRLEGGVSISHSSSFIYYAQAVARRAPEEVT